MISGCEGNRSSICFDCRNCGSRDEKKKFSSTTGLRSTRAATKTKSPSVTSSICQCVPDGIRSFMRSNNFHRTRRQRLEKGATVRLGYNAIVENDDDAFVAFGANQAPHALA